jgi:hypothetical protein
MTKTDTAPVEATTVEQDPRLIAGHPLCNYQMLFSREAQKTVILNGDPLNPQYTHRTLSINGFDWEPIEFGKPTKIPASFAAMVAPPNGVVLD